MEKKYTPGPWKIDPIGDKLDTDTIEIFAGNKWVADAKGVHVGPLRGEEVRANAHLIAAAPELLEVLENIIEGLDEAHYPTSMNEYIKKAKQAIKKATGGNP
jgi:hypothetical protein